MGVTTATLTLLPPRRLGHLLCEGRTSRGRSLADVAAASQFSEQQLLAVESGERHLDGEELDDVLAAYQVTPEELFPARSQVVVDLDQGQLLVAEEAATLDSEAPTPDEVLSAYLSLVYTLRNATPGTPVVLRNYDVAVLSRALRLAEPDVEARLVGLMADPSPELGRLHKLLRSKLVVPVVGAVVVATAVGTVLVLRADDSPWTTGPAISTPAPVEAPVATDVSLVPPVQQERNPDGSPGAVEEVAP
jgi:transcriptional regulator with XRE-family HTH domain